MDQALVRPSRDVEDTDRIGPAGVPVRTVQRAQRGLRRGGRAEDRVLATDTRKGAHRLVGTPLA